MRSENIIHNPIKSGIHLTKIWFDNDIIELKIDVSDGNSLFSNRVYVSYSRIANVITELDVFKDQVYGGVLDLRFGEFGLEYANGAFHARLHFAKPGKLYITCKQQSEFKDFSVMKAASEATLYLKTEPALLNNFIDALKSLYKERGEKAYLQAI
ncbi:hypothetical protein [Myxosarcina sp. GI1]|uniref:hypothetical protein n=1 Tax=Myxosarcina sp. GI1 TaxID=1541065 RepID=UPI001C0F3C67|nr:hypothetical protein [Myxosarcina sp. GI1]